MTAQISARILAKVAQGMTVSAAIDAVLGDGTFAKLAGEVYDGLRDAARALEHGAEFNETETLGWTPAERAANNRLISQSRELFERADKLRVCERSGHNFVLNRDATGFSCSHGCGERRPRTVSCGCCSFGCVCANHQDVPQGRSVTTCEYHKHVAHPRETSPIPPRVIEYVDDSWMHTKRLFNDRR